ncbi:MFS transporter [Halomarina ordinaria]|uniref:CynX/NimT family MFS transporter n=1 Tax=Halomarina ordinaria TaxID=3033939 RepID=A0ABD5U3R7_9EURY|nr:MFS transporter [Halomarina sp. PSRA2]
MDETPPPRSYLLVVLGGASYCLLMFVWFALSAFLTPMTDDLGLTSTQAGLLVGAVPLTYVPLSLSSGLVVDRVGPLRAIGAGTVLFGLAQVLRGVAPDYPTMLALTVLLGVGATAVTFGLPKLVSELFPASRVGTLSTVYLLGSYVGTAAAFVARPTLGPALGGWRPTFVASGLVTLAFAGLWAVVSWWFSAPRFGDDGPAPSVRRDLTRVLSHGELRLLVVVGSGYLFVMHGLQGWLPAVLESRGLTPALAGGVATGFVVARVVGTLVVPPLSDALAKRRAPVVACGALTALGCAGLVSTAAPVWGAALAVAVCGVGVGGVAPLVRALPTEMEGIGPRLTATAVGLVFAVGEVGGFVAPLLVGAARDLTGGFAPGLLALALAGASMALAGAFLSDPV